MAIPEISLIDNAETAWFRVLRRFESTARLLEYFG